MRSTPHINPTAPIAETILLPGDPLRAKFIAENYLEDVQQFNAVRNMLGFTGTYQGTPVSVMGSGMGIPLHLPVRLRAHPRIRLHAPRARGHLRRPPVGRQPVRRRGRPGRVLELRVPRPVPAARLPTRRSAPTASSRTWCAAPARPTCRSTSATSCPPTRSTTRTRRSTRPGSAWACSQSRWRTAGLYATAAHAGVEALGIFTVSDSLVTGEATDAQARQTSFTTMMGAGPCPLATL